ncbi:MAG: hypothetical protein EOP04_05265 [Proteobacteria bacterium]|nr:MAG: hypothetical protein EOP04_05265 [Pseudomonadota bacterium]
MIKLDKLKTTVEMEAQIQARISQFEELKNRGEEIPKNLLNAYNNDEIKNLLKQETNEKCAYCESKMLHVDYGDIEHIVPKGEDALLRYSYENLTLACGVCNTNKSTHLDVINPYEVDPTKHLFALGPMVLRRPHSDEGLLTEKRLRLNRPALLLKRAERLESLASIGDSIAKTSKENIKKVLLEELSFQCADNTEYSFVAKAYFKEISNSI